MSMISSESSSGGDFCKPPFYCWFRYHLFVSNTTSLFQIPSLCFKYHLFVSNTISLFQIPHLCFRYHLFVSNTISLFQIPPLCFRYHLFDKKTLNAQEFKEAVEKITKLKISGGDSNTKFPSYLGLAKGALFDRKWPLEMLF